MNWRSELGLCLLGTGVGLAVDMAQTPFTILGTLCLGQSSWGSAASLDLWMMPYSHFGMLLGFAICSWPRLNLAGSQVWWHTVSRAFYAVVMFSGMLGAEVLAMSLRSAQHSFAVMVAAMVGGMICAAYACSFVSARIADLRNVFPARAHAWAGLRKDFRHASAAIASRHFVL